MTAIRKSSSLAQDEDGVTIIEFGIVAPVFCLMLMATFDLGYSVYMQSTLSGAVQHAGRLSALEGSQGTLSGFSNDSGSIDNSIDAFVESQITKLNKSATVTPTRLSYYEYQDVGRAEDYSDTNGNGVFDDDSECFVDENENGSWDEDVGEEGIGGPNDIVYYKVSVTYDRLFPMWGLLGWAKQNEVSASTVLKNQPYGDQYAATTQTICP